jgi:tetratricopeptide (TPR) repeat protein
MLLTATTTVKGWRASVSPVVVEKAELTPEEEYNAGRQAYAASDWAAAEDHFYRVLKYNRAHARAWFARGRVQLMQGDPTQALVYFHEAKKRQEDGPTLACLAYCSGLVGDNQEAIYFSRLATDQGFAPAVVVNNWGFCHLQVNQLHEARAKFDEAIGLDPRLRAAYHNRLVLAIRERLQPKPSPVSEQALADIPQALQLGSPTPDLHLDAARLLALAAEDASQATKSGQRANVLQTPSAQQALHHIRQALLLGADLRLLERDTVLFRTLGPRWASGLKQPSPPQPNAPVRIRLVDPYPDLPG